jgi:predicted GNAT family acetyltransferase
VTIDVADNAAALQYEVTVDGEPAGLIRYTREGDTLTMLHTEVEPKLEGHGIGSELVKRALDDVRAKGEHVRPLCPFVAAYIDDHPEYADLVDE